MFVCLFYFTAFLPECCKGNFIMKELSILLKKDWAMNEIISGWAINEIISGPDI